MGRDKGRSILSQKKNLPEEDLGEGRALPETSPHFRDVAADLSRA